MPLVGLRCPNNELVDFDFCLGKCTDRCTPYPLSVQIINDNINNFHSGDVITATSIISCIRKTFLERITPYYNTFSNLWYSARGTWMHNVLESLKGDIRWMVEERFYADFNGVTLSGQIDAFHKTNSHLYDYKTTMDKNIQYIKNHGVKKEHSLQASIYKYIMNKNNINVKSASISYMSMAEVYTCDNIFLYSDDTIEDFLDKYAVPLCEAFKTGEAPSPPDPKPIWLCADFCPVNTICLGGSHDT